MSGCDFYYILDGHPVPDECPHEAGAMLCDFKVNGACALPEESRDYGPKGPWFPHEPCWKGLLEVKRQGNARRAKDSCVIAKGNGQGIAWECDDCPEQMYCCEENEDVYHGDSCEDDDDCSRAGGNCHQCNNRQCGIGYFERECNFT